MDTPPAALQPLPLFPLNSVLYPGGLLPLQIFEPRYLDMIGRRHRDGAPFGVVALSTGREVRLPGDGGYAQEALHAVGTLARIDELERPRPGLMVIRCSGTHRFKILNGTQGAYGLWTAEVELVPDDTAVAVPTDLAHTRETLRALLDDTREEAATHPGAMALELPEPHRWDDCGWLANRWCELLPVDVVHKQRLLTLDSPLLRLEMVADVLAQLGHGATS